MNNNAHFFFQMMPKAMENITEDTLILRDNVTITFTPNNSLSTTSHTIDTNPEESLLLLVPLLVSCCLAIILNILVCHLIVTSHRLKTPTNVFVFSLCVCNINFAGLLIPMHCFNIGTLIYSYITLITVLTYIGNLTAVTSERLFSIVNPFRYQTLMTIQNAIKSTLTAWTVPLLYSILPLFWGSDPTLVVHKIYITGTLVIFLIIPLFFIIFVYVKVCLEITNMYKYYNTVSKGQKCHVERNRKWTDCLRMCFPDSVTAPKISVSSTQMTSTEMPDISITGPIEPPDADKQPEEEDSHLVIENKAACDSANEDRIHKGCERNSLVRSEQSSTRTSATLSFEGLSGSMPSLISTESRAVKEPFIIRRSCGDISDVTTKPNSNRQKQRKTSRKTSLSRLKKKMGELQASLAFALVAFTYMFTWLPVVGLTLMDVIGKGAETPPALIEFSIFAIAVNSLTDPILYALLLRNFKSTIRSICRNNRYRCCIR